MNNKLLLRADKRNRGCRVWELGRVHSDKFQLVRSVRRDGLPYGGSFNRWHVVRFSDGKITYPNKRQLTDLLEAILDRRVIK